MRAISLLLVRSTWAPESDVGKWEANVGKCLVALSWKSVGRRCWSNTTTPCETYSHNNLLSLDVKTKICTQGRLTWKQRSLTFKKLNVAVEDWRKSARMRAIGLYDALGGSGE
jgi:hypothetical protein